MKLSKNLKERIIVSLTDTKAGKELINAIESGTGGPTITATSPIVYNPISGNISLNFGGTSSQYIRGDGSVENLSTIVPVAARAMYVADNGNDTTGNGSSSKPFATVQKAVDSLPVGGHAVVYIMPGNYAGKITITRTKTHLIGLGSTNANVNSVQIGPVEYNISGATAGVNNENSSICNVLISGTAGEHCVNFLGSEAVSVYLVNTYAFTNEPGQSGVYMNNSASRIYLFNSILNASASTGTSITLHVVAGSVWQTIDTQIYNASTNTAARAIKLEGSSAMVTADRLNISGKGQYVIELSGATSVANLSSSYVEQVTANASGINLAAGSQLVSVRNAFNVPAGTGLCVNGSLGAALIHAQSVFFANTKFASAMGPGVIALATTPTAG